MDHMNQEPADFAAAVALLREARAEITRLRHDLERGMANHVADLNALSEAKAAAVLHENSASHLAQMAVDSLNGPLKDAAPQANGETQVAGGGRPSSPAGAAPIKASNEMLARWTLKNLLFGEPRAVEVQFLAEIFAEHWRQAVDSLNGPLKNAAPQAGLEPKPDPIGSRSDGPLWPAVAASPGPVERVTFDQCPHSQFTYSQRMAWTMGYNESLGRSVSGPNWRELLSVAETMAASGAGAVHIVELIRANVSSTATSQPSGHGNDPADRSDFGSHWDDHHD